MSRSPHSNSEEAGTIDGCGKGKWFRSQDTISPPASIPAGTKPVAFLGLIPVVKRLEAYYFFQGAQDMGKLVIVNPILFLEVDLLTKSNLQDRF